MGCILNLTSPVLEAGGIGYRSISAVGTNFRLFPADLYWMCLAGYGGSLWTICTGWRNSVSEFERDMMSILGCCKIIKYISESIR